MSNINLRQVIAIYSLVVFIGIVGVARAGSMYEGRIVKGQFSPKLYLIEGGLKKYIPDANSLAAIRRRVNPKIIIISDKELKAMSDTNNVTPGDNPPAPTRPSSLEGRVIKGSSSQLYVIENGLRRIIPDEDTFNSFRYNMRLIVAVPDSSLESFPPGNILKKGQPYPDHTLIKSTGTKVYVMIQGRRRWIINDRVFASHQFSRDSIITIDDKTMTRISEGPALTELLFTAPDTIILDGPKNGSTLERLDTISFRFGVTMPYELKNIQFETFLQGYDDQWKNVRDQTEINYNLDKITRNYIFYVRARDVVTGNIDQTPTKSTFRIDLSALVPSIVINGITLSTDANKEYVTLSVTNDQQVPISITGWTIEDERGRSHKIGQAIKMYQASSQNIESNAVVNPGDRIIILSGRSPLGSGGFMLNTCMAYLRDTVGFVPGISSSCPKLPEEQVLQLDSTENCWDYVRNLRKCVVPQSLVGIESQRLGSICTDWVQSHISYSGCINDNWVQPDFFNDEWRLYLNAAQHIWDKRGIIRLRDDKGRLVAEKRFGGY